MSKTSNIKRALKAILMISICLGIGFLIGYVFGKIFGGGPAEQAQAAEGVAKKDIALIIISSLLGIFGGTFLQLIIHEAGHLVCGLMSNYKFVSFRILKYTLFKEDNKLKVKEFSVSGTAGQCLLSPPDKPTEKVPIFLYQIGGVLFNLFLSAALMALAVWGTDNDHLRMALIITTCMGVLLVLANGIPMIVEGFPNDGYNVLHLNRDLKAKSALLNLLRANALVQGGTRPRDLPNECFAKINDSDLSNCLEANLAVMYLSVLVQKGQISEAENLSRRIIDESKIGVIQLEAKLELACMLFNQGKSDEALALFDKNELKMIETSAKTQSSKQRFLFLRALKAENDRQKAIAIFEHVQSAKDKYLMKGEVAMALELMWNALKD